MVPSHSIIKTIKNSKLDLKLYNTLTSRFANNNLMTMDANQLKLFVMRFSKILALMVCGKLEHSLFCNLCTLYRWSINYTTTITLSFIVLLLNMDIYAFFSDYVK